MLCKIPSRARLHIIDARISWLSPKMLAVRFIDLTFFWSLVLTLMFAFAFVEQSALRAYDCYIHHYKSMETNRNTC
jgi:hypothetical protein